MRPQSYPAARASRTARTISDWHASAMNFTPASANRGSETKCPAGYASPTKGPERGLTAPRTVFAWT